MHCDAHLEFSLCHMVVSKLEHAAAELHTMYQPMRCKLRRPACHVTQLHVSVARAHCKGSQDWGSQGSTLGMMLQFMRNLNPYLLYESAAS